MLEVKNKDLQRAKYGASKSLVICLRKAVVGTPAVNDDRRSASCDGGEMWCDTAEEQCLTSKRLPGLWELSPPPPRSPSLFFFFFLSCEGRHTLQPENPFIHHSGCLWERRWWLQACAGLSFPAISFRAGRSHAALDDNEPDKKRAQQGPFSRSNDTRAFHFDPLRFVPFTCLFGPFLITERLALYHFRLVCDPSFALPI